MSTYSDRTRLLESGPVRIGTQLELRPDVYALSFTY